MDRIAKDCPKTTYYLPSWWRQVRNESVFSSLPQASSEPKSRTLGRSVCSKLDEELFLETEKALSRTLRSSREAQHDLDRSSHSRKNHTVKLERFLASVMEAKADSRNPCLASVRSSGIRDSKELLFSKRNIGNFAALQNSLPGNSASLCGNPALGQTTCPFFVSGRPCSNKTSQTSGSRPSGERSLRLAPGSGMLDLNNNYCHLSHTFRSGLRAKDASSAGRLG